MITVFRKELKYTIYAHEFARMRSKLSAVMHRDVNGGDFGYTVRSLYFDSIYDKDLYDTIEGNLVKSKIRLRIYGDGSDGVIKFELKQKEGAESLKRSLLVSREEAEALQECDYEFLRDREEPVARSLYMQLVRGAYQPKTLVEYEREAYTYPIGNIRVTFDSNTRATGPAWRLFDVNPPWTTVVPVGSGVLEVKYSTVLPAFLKGFVETGRIVTANSKYAQGRQFYQWG